MNRPSTTFPSQFISESEKTQEWCDQMINAIMGYITGTNSPFDSSRSTDIQAYNIYNGHINRDSYKYVTEQYGTTYPARLVNYPIIQPKIDLLLGEDLKRPLDYKVSTVNKDAVVRKEDFKVSLMMNALLKDDPNDKIIIDKLLENPNLPKQPDLHIHIVIPNEFQPMGKYNIGITAGLEMTVCPPRWLEGMN